MNLPYNPGDFTKIGNEKISVITFNYDRSLEHYVFENLYGLLENSGIQRKELADVINHIPFIHVYGSLGKLPWQVGVYGNAPYLMGGNPSFVQYGGSDTPPFTSRKDFLKVIQLMYEERKSNPEILAAKKLIAEADRIFFLGFGYDPINLEILGLPDLLTSQQIYGTAYGCTESEIDYIKTLLNPNDSMNTHIIYNCDCLTLLRNHFI